MTRRARRRDGGQRRADRARWPLFFGLAAVGHRRRPAHEGLARLGPRPGRGGPRSSATYVRLVHSQNSGALFGLFRDQAILFGLVSIGVVGLIVWFHGNVRPQHAAVGRPRPAAGRRHRQHGRPVPTTATSSTSSTSGSATCAGTRSTSPMRRSAVRSVAAAPGSRRSCPDAGDAGARTPSRYGPSRRPARCLTAPVAAGDPDGPRAGRRDAAAIDRFVADATGLSRSHVQKLISDGRLTGRRRAAAGERASSPVGAELRLDVPEPRGARPRAGARHPARDRLRGRRPADRRQAGRARRPPVGRSSRRRHAGQRAAGARGRGRVRRHRRASRARASSIASTATRAGCSWSPSTTPRSTR